MPVALVHRKTQPFGLIYVLGPNTCKSYTMQDPTLLGLATRLAQTPVGIAPRQGQTPVGLAPCQAHPPWARLHAKPKCLWVWHLVRPIPFRLGYAPNPNACGSSTLSDPTPHEPNLSLGRSA